MECTERTLITSVWTFHYSWSDHVCFDHKSRKLKSTALEQKRFDLQLLSPALHNLWLLLVLKHTVFPIIFLTLISGSQLVWKFRHQTPSVYLCSDIPLTVTSAFYQGPAGPDGIAGKDGEQVRNAVLLYYPPLIARTFTCDDSWIKDEKGSRAVPINPSPKPTLTLTSRLGQNVGLREGQVGSFPETYNTWSLFSSLSSVTLPDVFAKAHSTQMSFRKFTRSSSFLVSKVAKKCDKEDYSKIIAWSDLFFSSGRSWSYWKIRPSRICWWPG